jgi:hypothetical protein
MLEVKCQPFQSQNYGAQTLNVLCVSLVHQFESIVSQRKRIGSENQASNAEALGVVSGVNGTTTQA